MIINYDDFSDMLVGCERKDNSQYRKNMITGIIFGRFKGGTPGIN